MVQACRYVDEAVEIPFEFCDTKDAYLKYQFDAQFSGSDYAWGSCLAEEAGVSAGTWS